MNRYWTKSIVSVGVILSSMPVVHLIAWILKDIYSGTQLFGAGIAVGFVGLVMVNNLRMNIHIDKPSSLHSYAHIVGRPYN